MDYETTRRKLIRSLIITAIFLLAATICLFGARALDDANNDSHIGVGIASGACYVVSIICALITMIDISNFLEARKSIHNITQTDNNMSSSNKKITGD